MTSPSSTGRATAWKGSARPASIDSASTETAVPSSTSRPRPRTPPAPQPTRADGDSASCTPSSVASGAARCPPEANTIASSHGLPAETRRRLVRRGHGALPGVELRGQPGADAYGHRC
jgi:hypothetical protein